jgi:hypothetical protein
MERGADANLGTDKMGSGAYGPSGSRAEPWPYFIPASACTEANAFIAPAMATSAF